MADKTVHNVYKVCGITSLYHALLSFWSFMHSSLFHFIESATIFSIFFFVKLSQFSVYSFKWKWNCHKFQYILLSESESVTFFIIFFLVRERESINFHLKIFIVFQSNWQFQSGDLYVARHILPLWLPRLGDPSKLRNGYSLWARLGSASSPRCADARTVV